ncbi:MAG: L-threonylcarbamoyladenylate synthase [Halobacteria archaeon]
MRTRVLRIRRGRDPGPQVEPAAVVLRKGGLVAFPTETVYGLGASALDSRAAARIFRAKGRPADNPVIVHVGRMGDLGRVAGRTPPSALRLARAFWPGPLTLLFPKHPRLPRVVTAGLPTVAVRMPAHPVALELIRRAGVPVAAPSANRSGRPSPTRARDVLEDLEGRVEMVVDGGPTPIGVESTVLDTLASPPVLLRPGAVPREALERVAGPVRLHPGLEKGAASSPGLKHRHYAPKARIVLVEGTPPEVRKKMGLLARDLRSRGKSVAALVASTPPPPSILVRRLGRDPRTAARRLFASLRDLDREGVDVILVENFGPGGLGLALRDRLERAAKR